MAKKKEDKFDSFDRTDKVIVRYGNDNYKAAGRLCQLSRRLYNRANYLMRHEMFDGKKPKHTDVDKILKQGRISEDDQVLYKRLAAGVSQRITQILGADWSSFYEAIKDYKKSPDKYTGRPKPPQYSNQAHAIYIPRNSFKVKDGYIHFAKQLNLEPIPSRHTDGDHPYNEKADKTVIKEIRIIPKGNCYVFEIVYNSLLSRLCHNPLRVLLDRNRVAAIDLGVNTLACLVTNQPDIAPVLINGRPVKSINAHYNKRAANLASCGNHGHIQAIANKRDNRLKDYLHRASNYVLQFCLNNDLGTLVIGYNKGWKREIEIGKQNNQKFCFIPHLTFVEQLKYKCRAYGIDVIVREESYTSQASAKDLDSIPTYKENVKNTVKFSGRRVKRGIYRNSNGSLVNADLNGGLNIMRKEIGDALANIAGLFDSGCVFQPISVTLGKSARECGEIRRIRPEQNSKLPLAA